MDTETAFAAYEAVRHRLPPPRMPETGHVAAGTLDDIAEEFDVFLLDAFGVLNIGETAIPGVAARIDGLRGQGKRVMVITNAAGYPNAALLAKYERLGFSFSPQDVVSSRTTLLAHLGTDAGQYWGLMASRRAGLADLEKLDLVYLAEDPAAYASAEAFLLLGSAEWTEARQDLLEAALADRPRPVWVGNPDIVAPREDGFSLEPGHFAHRLADATGVSPRFYGKPFANVFDLALDRLDGNVDRGRVVMVGDSLHTDVLGAHTAGVASALVSGFGFFAGHDARAAIARSGIEPTYVLDRP